MTRKPSLPWLLLLPALVLVLFWAYWPTFVEMAGRWTSEPQYSHGYLVPAFAGFLLWSRRKMAETVRYKPNWWGLLVLAVGGAIYLAGAYGYFNFLDGLSLLPVLVGLTILLGSWPALRWAWPAIGFLAFMLPLPFRVETAFAGKLQQIGTITSTYTLQTLGFPALSEGNVILVNEHKIGVVEACSGLSMLVIFFALAVAFALVVKRPLLDKLVLLVSAAPIAILSNVARITVTGALYEMGQSKAAETFFHSVAGWLMMPLALGIMWVELWLIDYLLVLPGGKRKMLTIGLPEGKQAPALAPPVRHGA